MNKEAVENTGPGKYEPPIAKDINQVLNSRVVKSQSGARGPNDVIRGFQPDVGFFGKKKQEDMKLQKMEMRVRKQPKWH